MSKRVAIGPAIKAIRTAKGIPASQVATDCLMSAAHLCNIEADRRPATDEALERIARALDVDLGAISFDPAKYLERNAA